jgi:cyanate permease
MGVFEFLMLFCFGFSWPFSIAKSIRSRSSKGKSIMFMCMVELGYVFGIVHKLVNDCNWVIWMYVALFLVVAVDIALYFRNRRIDAAEQAAAR